MTVSSTRSHERSGRSAALRAGGWYYLVVIGTVGIFSALPFWHAVSRLHQARTRRQALIYSAAGVLIVLLSALIPQDAQGDTEPGNAWSGLYAMTAIAVMVAACVQLRPVRREVFGLRRPVPSSGDPVVARVLAARAQREEARALWDRDRAMGRELGIGRPDLGRGYDDGGLVDVNTAPAYVIASVIEISPDDAARIVEGREIRGGAYFGVGDVLMEVQLPVHAQDRLRERAVL